MSDNLDLKRMLSVLNSNDLMENISRLGQLMGNPEQGDKIKNLVNTLINEKVNEVYSVRAQSKHIDPAINLLMAIKPFLSHKKQAKLDQYLKTMNTTYVLRNLSDLD